MKEKLDGPAKQKLLGMISEALVNIEIDDEIKVAEPSTAHQFNDRYATAQVHTVELTVEMKAYLSPDGLIQLGLADEDEFTKE